MLAPHYQTHISNPNIELSDSCDYHTDTEGSDCEASTNSATPDYHEILSQFSITSPDDIQRMTMGLVLGQFEDSPHRAEISKILGRVWIGWDIMIDHSLLQDGEPAENPCWNQTNLDDYNLYDLV